VTPRSHDTGGPPRPAIPRRRFLQGGLGAAAALLAAPLACDRAPDGPPGDGGDGWDAGAVSHLLATANHRRIRLKASFREPPARPPRLAVGDRRVLGSPTDSTGRFFVFDVDGLAPAAEHRLRLLAADGTPLCHDWPLRTFPAPDVDPARLRLLVYTCAGGPEDVFGFFNGFLPVAQRQRLLARALSFAPDAIVANGDHVYWDMRSRMGWALGRSPWAWWRAGWFDRGQPVLGTENERVLKRAFGPQIAGLYGVRLRSVPAFFLQDDHDYGENDEASPALRTFPPDPFMLDLARSTQRLYYPELLADADLPRGRVNADGVSESFGALRFGRLFEALLYDCRRYLTNRLDPRLGHEHSAFVPPDVERWLLSRCRTSPCAHLAHMPSTPVLWTAGKWGEWYPDFQDAEGVLRSGAGKPYWPEGWGAQHDRLLAAASVRRDRTPLFVSGDLHATAAGRIHATHGRRLSGHPVVSLLCGSVGTGALGWPSRFRGQRPAPSGTLDAEEIVPAIEENGFSLLDIEPEVLRVSMFRWTPDQDPARIDTLAPFRELEFPRPRA
jgi:hypothetical protein